MRDGWENMRDGGKSARRQKRGNFRIKSQKIYHDFPWKLDKKFLRFFTKILCRDFCLASRAKIANFCEAKIRKNSPSLCEKKISQKIFSCYFRRKSQKVNTQALSVPKMAKNHHFWRFLTFKNTDHKTGQVSRVGTKRARIWSLNQT